MKNIRIATAAVFLMMMLFAPSMTNPADITDEQAIRELNQDNIKDVVREG